MFGARLFGIAALAIAVIAVVPGKLTDTTFDFYMHATYIVVAGRHAILAVALLCGVFAGFYYFGDRALGLRLNNGIVLAHFVLWIFSFVAFVLEAHGLARTIRSQQDPKSILAITCGICGSRARVHRWRGPFLGERGLGNRPQVQNCLTQ